MQKIRRVWYALRDFAARNLANAVSAYAAEATLFVVMSFFPSALLLLSLLPHLPFDAVQIENVFQQVIPEAIATFLQSVLQELYDAPPVTATVITAALALWSASRGSAALMRGLDRVYGIHRARGYVVLRLLASVYVLFFFVLLIIILAFLGFGGVVFDLLAQLFPALVTSMLLRRGLQSLVSFAVLFLLFWLLYVAAARQWARGLSHACGALVAAGGWVGFSSLFSYYLNRIGGYSLYYGSLSIVMFSLLWLYICMYIFFVGAGVNVWLRTHRQRLKNIFQER